LGTALKRVFGPKKEEVAGSWRRQQNEELHNLYASRNIIKVNRSRTMRRTWHVAHLVQMRNGYKIWSVKLKGKHSLDLDVDGKIMLEWMLGKQDGKVWSGFI
jgi:hypothetical protein